MSGAVRNLSKKDGRCFGSGFEGVTDAMGDEERSSLVSKNSAKIIAAAIENTHYTANVVPFYMGNQYFLFVYERYNDVRLVGAPVGYREVWGRDG